MTKTPIASGAVASLIAASKSGLILTPRRIMKGEKIVLNIHRPVIAAVPTFSFGRLLSDTPAFNEHVNRIADQIEDMNLSVIWPFTRCALTWQEGAAEVVVIHSGHDGFSGGNEIYIRQGDSAWVRFPGYLSHWGRKILRTLDDDLVCHVGTLDELHDSVMEYAQQIITALMLINAPHIRNSLPAESNLENDRPGKPGPKPKVREMFARTISLSDVVRAQSEHRNRNARTPETEKRIAHTRRAHNRTLASGEVVTVSEHPINGGSQTPPVYRVIA